VTHLLLLIAVIIWGLTFVASKFCLGVMSPIQLVAGRFLIEAPALYVVARLRGASFRLGAHKKVLLLAVVIFSFHYLLQTWALEFTTATNSGWLITVAPLTIALLAALFLREPAPPAVGILVASLGIVLLVSKGDLRSLGTLSSVGDSMVLASTFSWAVFTIITRNPSRALDPVVVTFVMTVPLAASALVLPLALDRWTAWSDLGLGTLLALLFLGLAGVALRSGSGKGVAKPERLQAGLFLYLEPLATTASPYPISASRSVRWPRCGPGDRRYFARRR
jgi:drug/metabolite transporter (DMT)-like permease